jgi:hypothetical protein
MFDEDGDFVDDHDALEFDVHVAPNPMSEKVARFVEWFSTTGDVARLYLELSGDDLEHAAQLYMTMPDAQEAAAAAAATSKRPSTHDGPMNPKNKPGDSSHPGGGSGNPSDSEEVGHRSKNKKGKQRATADDDDEDYKDVRWDDDSDDYGGNDDPFSGISRRAYNFREVLRHNANVDETQESFRDYARRQAQRAGPRGFPERHEKPERDSSALQAVGLRRTSMELLESIVAVFLRATPSATRTTSPPAPQLARAVMFAPLAPRSDATVLLVWRPTMQKMAHVSQSIDLTCRHQVLLLPVMLRWPSRGARILHAPAVPLSSTPPGTDRTSMNILRLLHVKPDRTTVSLRHLASPNLLAIKNRSKLNS